MKRREFIELAALGTAGTIFAEDGMTGKTVISVLNTNSNGHGCGLCVVIQTPLGKTYFFDLGVGVPVKGEKDNGEEIIMPWLKEHGVKQIDGLIISHYHSDHFGGLLSMWNGFPIKKIFNNNYNPPGKDGLPLFNGEGKACRKVLDAWEKDHPGMLVDNLREGMDLGWNEPGVSFDVVWPPSDEYIGEMKNRTGYVKHDTVYHHLLNGNSNGLRVTIGNKVFFIVGDIQPDYLKKHMLPRLEKCGKWGCDVCILPAHGTNTGEGCSLIEKMNPRPHTVVAALGNRKWMFDCAKTVKNHYAKRGFKCYSTNVDGHISFTFDGDEVTAVNDPKYVFPVFQ